MGVGLALTVHMVEVAVGVRLVQNVAGVVVM